MGRHMLFSLLLAWLCLGQGADLHMAQQTPLPLTISCSSKSRQVLPFWYRLTWVVPDKIQKSRETIVCVCVCGITDHTTRRCDVTGCNILLHEYDECCNKHLFYFIAEFILFYFTRAHGVT